MGRSTHQSGASANGRIDDTVDETSRLLKINVEREEYHKPIWDGLAEFEHLPKWRRPSIFWLMGPYFLFTLAYGGVMVPKVTLILDLVCTKYFASPVSPFAKSDRPQCNDPEVQKKVSEFMLVLNLLVGSLSAITAPKLGKLSDRYGRRRLFALSSLGGILAEAITILAAKFPQAVDYRWMVLGSLFEGLTGSLITGSILGQAYTSDCTPPSKRAVYMGYLFACLLGGVALGPLLAGYLIKVTGSVVTLYYVVLLCHATFALFIGFVVPESLSKRRQNAARASHQLKKEALSHSSRPWVATILQSNPFQPLAILWPRGPGTSRRLRVNLLALSVTDAILTSSVLSVGSVIILYSKYMFGWDTFEMSLFVSGMSSIRVVMLLVIFPIINYWFRVRSARRQQERALVEKTGGADSVDIWTLRAALLSDTLGALSYSLARTPSAFVASGAVTAFGGLGSAIIQSAITKHVPPSSVGEALGAVGMLNAIARVLSPILFNGLYALTVRVFPQAVFTMMCGLFGIGLLASFAIHPHVVWDHESEAPSPPATADAEAAALAQETDTMM